MIAEDRTITISNQLERRWAGLAFGTAHRRRKVTLRAAYGNRALPKNVGRYYRRFSEGLCPKCLVQCLV